MSDSEQDLYIEQLVEHPYQYNDIPEQFFNDRLIRKYMEKKGGYSTEIGLFFMKRGNYSRQLYIDILSSKRSDLKFLPIGLDFTVIPEKYKTQDFYLEAFSEMKGPIAVDLKHVPEEFLTPELIGMLTFIGDGLEQIPNKYKTRLMCWQAIRESGVALRFVPEKFISDKMIDVAIENNCWVVDLLPPEKLTPARVRKIILLDVKQEYCSSDPYWKSEEHVVKHFVTMRYMIDNMDQVLTTDYVKKHYDEFFNGFIEVMNNQVLDDNEHVLNKISKAIGSNEDPDMIAADLVKCFEFTDETHNEEIEYFKKIAKCRNPKGLFFTYSLQLANCAMLFQKNLILPTHWQTPIKQ